MDTSASRRTATWLLCISALILAGCTSSSSSGEETEEETGTFSIDGTWYKSWTSPYKFGAYPTNYCDAMIAEFSGSSCKLVFYADTQQVYGLKGTFTRTGTTSGTVTYSFTEEWDSTNRTWVGYPFSQTQAYTADSATSFSGVDWAGVKQTYAKLAFSRPASFTGIWGGSADFDGSESDPAMNITWSAAAGGTFVFNMEGDSSQTQTGDSWGVAQVSSSSWLLRCHSTARGADTGKSMDELLPFAISGSVMSLNPGKANAFTFTKAVVFQGTVDTFAGNDTSATTNGTGTAASFVNPVGLCSDGVSLYVADRPQHVIRRIRMSDTGVSTFAGTAGTAGDMDEVGTLAEFDSPSGICCDASNVYVADTNNHAIRIIDKTTAAVATFAGTINTASFKDETGTNAWFNYPYGIACDDANLYVADASNYRIRKISKTTAEVTTLAGNGTSGSGDGTGTAATFGETRGLAVDDRYVYVADTYNHTIRRIDKSTAEVVTLAGTAGASGTTDGTGSSARFNNPWGLALNGPYLYVADEQNHKIRRLDLGTREVTTVAGLNPMSFADGTLAAASFNYPEGLVFEGSALYVADSSNHRVRKIH